MAEDGGMKRGGGRPGRKCTMEDVRLAELYSSAGADKPKLAKLLKVTTATVTRWMYDHDEFQAAVLKGRDAFDLEIAENSLLKKVTGYNQDEVTRERRFVPGENGEENSVEVIETKRVTKHFAADTNAIKFFLANRSRHNGRWTLQLYGDNPGAGGAGSEITGGEKEGDEIVIRINRRSAGIEISDDSDISVVRKQKPLPGCDEYEAEESEEKTEESGDEEA